MISMLKHHFKASKWLDIKILSILSLSILITRFPFTSNYLFEWDSVNFALGFEKYSILLNQPHSPGYILFIGLGRIINGIFHDANTTMIFISIIFSIFTVILTYFLAKQMFSRKIALVASILLIFNPLLWFYGEISTIYPSEAFFATLIAYLSYNVFKGNEKYFYLSTIALGLAGGFRQDLIIFMLPLWLFCLFYYDRSSKRIIKAFAVLITSILIWFIPTIILAGGYNSYMLASGVITDSFKTTSVLFGAPLLNHLLNDAMLLSWLFLALGIIGAFLVIIFILINRKTILNRNFLKNPKFLLLSLWISPMLLFQILIHSPKPGYILLYISAIVLTLACVFNSFSISAKKINFSSKSILSILIIIYIFVNSLYFIYPYNLHSEITWETSINDMNQTQKITLGLDMLFMYNYEKIYINDRSMELHLNAISNISKSNNSLIIIRDILREDQGFSWRKVMYYLPDYDTYYILDDENSQFKSSKTSGNIQLIHGKNHNSDGTIIHTLKIPINQSTERIIWVMSDKTEFFKKIESRTKINTISLPNGLKLYYSNIQSENKKNSRFFEV